jgi:hypothetical protein
MTLNHTDTCLTRVEPTVTSEHVLPSFPLLLKCPLICLKTSPRLVLPFSFDFVRFLNIETTIYKRKMLTVIQTAQTNRTTLFKGSHPSTLLIPTKLYTRVECALLGATPTVCGGS